MDGTNTSTRTPGFVVIANGTEVRVPAACTLEQFLESQGLRPRSVVVEQNGEAVSPSTFSARTVRAGDRLEIVRIVAGG
jgi:thiamine biosynthesis protein ThiS